MNTSNYCPCGSNKSFSECCELFISGKQLPPTPEALMRSRYTAFTQANVDYIAATMKGEVAEQFNLEQTRDWANHVDWLGLQVVTAAPTTEFDHKGLVEFIVRYRFQGKLASIHELSEFRREEGRWYYTNGNAPKHSSANKIGRNDPCFCGSSKKFKKCCGN